MSTGKIELNDLVVLDFEFVDRYNDMVNECRRLTDELSSSKPGSTDGGVCAQEFAELQASHQRLEQENKELCEKLAAAERLRQQLEDAVKAERFHFEQRITEMENSPQKLEIKDVMASVPSELLSSKDGLATEIEKYVDRYWKKNPKSVGSTAREFYEMGVHVKYSELINLDIPSLQAFHKLLKDAVRAAERLNALGKAIKKSRP